MQINILLAIFIREEADQHASDAGSSTEHIADITVEVPTIDFTPADLITLLFTDLGVLTPAAVSDELIRLYC